MVKYFEFCWDNRIGPIIFIKFFNKRIALTICHRDPSRSIWFFGLEHYFCSRCIGIIFGGILGFLLLAVYNVKILFIYFIILSLPLVLDGFTQLSGLRESTNGIRIVTGFLAGFGLNGSIV